MQQAFEIPSYVPWAMPLLVIGILVQFLWSTVVSVVLYKLSKNDRIDERLKKSLHEATEKVIDERFRHMSHEMAGSVNAFKLTLESLSVRLADAHHTIDELCDEDHKLEVATLKQIGDLQRQMITREDLERFKQDVLRQMARGHG